MDDLKKNPDAVKTAIAAALGISPEEVDLAKIEETEDGIKIETTHPADTSTDTKDFANKLEKELKKEDGFENVNVARNQFF